MKNRPRHSSLRYGKPSPFVKDREKSLAMLCVGLIALCITLAALLGQTARELRIAEAKLGYWEASGERSNSSDYYNCIAICMASE